MMKTYDRLMNALGVVAALMVAGLTALVTYDVVARNLGLGSLDWVLEISEYMLPTLISFTAPWLMYKNQHVRIDILQAILPRAASVMLDRISAAVGIATGLLFAWFALQLLLDSKASLTLVFKSLIFPEWWLYITTPLGFLLLSMECGRQVLWPPGVGGEDKQAGVR